MKKNTLIVLFLLAVILCFTSLFGLDFLADPFTKQKLIAWRYGAEFIDTVGVIIQNKNNTCGPTVLKMIFDRYGIESSLNEIEQDIQLSSKGSSLQALKSIAQSKGLLTEGWRLSILDLTKEKYPMILFVHHDHFVIADSMDKNNNVYLSDPALGRLKIAKNTLSSIWNGEALLFRKQNN